MSASARLLPTNLAAEQALLGAVLANNKAFDLVGELRSEHFADEVNAVVFEAIRRRILAGHKVDPVTISAFLENLGVLSEAGGAAAYLSSLLSAMVSIDLASEYASAIMDTALRRALIKSCEITIDRAYGAALADGAGVETAAAAIAEIERLAAESGGAQAVSIRRAVEAAIASSEAAHRGDKGAACIPLGIRALDERWGGLYPACLDLLGARSMAGKTALASQLARNIAGTGVPVAFFSLEVGRQDWGMAQLASLSGVSVDDLRNGRLDDKRSRAIIEAQKVLAALPIELVDKPDINLDEVVAEMRVLKRQRGCRVFVIDHRNKIARPDGWERATKLDWYGHITDRLKRAAKALDVSVLLLVQLSRAMMRRDDPRPCVADLEYAGEQDADNIALLWRPIMHLAEPTQGPTQSGEAHANAMARYLQQRADMADVAEVIMAKRRFGQPGTAKLTFDGATLSFSDPAAAFAEVPDDLLAGRWGV